MLPASSVTCRRGLALRRKIKQTQAEAARVKGAAFFASSAIKFPASADSLKKQDHKLYDLAEKILDSKYDGMDTGPVGKRKQAIKWDTKSISLERKVGLKTSQKFPWTNGRHILLPIQSDGLLSGIEVYGLAGDVPAALPSPCKLRPFGQAGK